VGVVVIVDVSVPVEMLVGVSHTVGVEVQVAVLLDVGVGVGVDVAVKVNVRVAVGVSVHVLVLVRVFVAVNVAVEVPVAVEVDVLVQLGVLVGGPTHGIYSTTAASAACGPSAKYRFPVTGSIPIPCSPIDGNPASAALNVHIRFPLSPYFDTIVPGCPLLFPIVKYKLPDPSDLRYVPYPGTVHLPT
jgi:hypothetical protein